MSIVKIEARRRERERCAKIIRDRREAMEPKLWEFAKKWREVSTEDIARRIPEMLKQLEDEIMRGNDKPRSGEFSPEEIELAAKIMAAREKNPFLED